MKQPLTPQQIIRKFYLDRLLFCGLGIITALGFIALLISAGHSGTIVGIPIWILQIILILITIGSLLWSIDNLGDCPSCGHSPYHNSQNPFPATCKHCGVRLL
jgi:hypothetical protein